MFYNTKFREVGGWERTEDKVRIKYKNMKKAKCEWRNINALKSIRQRTELCDYLAKAKVNKVNDRDTQNLWVFCGYKLNVR